MRSICGFKSLCFRRTRSVRTPGGIAGGQLARDGGKDALDAAAQLAQKLAHSGVGIDSAVHNLNSVIHDTAAVTGQIRGHVFDVGEPYHKLRQAAAVTLVPTFVPPPRLPFKAVGDCRPNSLLSPATQHRATGHSCKFQNASSRTACTLAGLAKIGIRKGYEMELGDWLRRDRRHSRDDSWANRTGKRHTRQCDGRDARACCV